MNFLKLIFQVADKGLAALQVADTVYTAGKKLVRRLKSPTKPAEITTPLTHDNVVDIQDQIRSATKPPLKR